MTTPNPASTFYDYGLTASRNDGRGAPASPGQHHHNEFELLLLTRGETLHEHAGRVFNMPLRRLVMLWGGISHRTINRRPGSQTWALHIPMGVFLGWGLPQKTFVHPLLDGGIFFESNPACSAPDAAAMRRWFDDISHAGKAGVEPAPETGFAAAAARRSAMLCELQARVLRFVLGNSGVRMDDAGGEHGSGAIGRMLRHIAENYRDPALDVAAIARHARLHPGYASELFHRTCGVSLMRYVTRQRITHAQCLLSGGGAKILDIALDSGFGSESRFYQVFRAAIGVTPREYAKARGNTPRG